MKLKEAYRMDDIEFAISRRGLNLDVTYKCPLACPKCMRQYYKSEKIPIGGHEVVYRRF